MPAYTLFKLYNRANYYNIKNNIVKWIFLKVRCAMLCTHALGRRIGIMHVGTMSF